MLEIKIISCLNDNYSYIIRDDKTNLVGVVDPSEFAPIDKSISKDFNKIDFIFNTHHHLDHVGANIELKNKYNSNIIGSKIDKDKIPGIDIFVGMDDEFKFGSITFKILFVPGHTKGHIAFFSQNEKLIFTGDTLFSLGCGRIFEGTYKDMFNSLNQIKCLPKDTKIYCGHEYTANNIKFCAKYDFNNKDLIKKLGWINERLDKKLPTIPTTIEDELKTNIFLRCDNSDIKNNLKMSNSSDELIFEKLRNLKDQF
jgi:hydroxyacylglutathione hydrolase|tara:strand:- start:47 stop:811 length:765 start_codon:yes stop_codon:yes gene_type:complete